MEPAGLRTVGKKYENHNKFAHINNCSSVKGELVLVQFCELLIDRSSSTMVQIHVVVSDQPDDVANNTVGGVVFIMKYFETISETLLTWKIIIQIDKHHMCDS